MDEEKSLAVQAVDVMFLALPEQFRRKISQPTPKKYIDRRPARGGGEWDYVQVGYVRRRLDELFSQFGWRNTCREVSSMEDVFKSEQVVVHVRLEVVEPATGRVVTWKDAYGSAEVKFLKGTKTPLDLGNDFKSAAADGLKKAASLLGICADVYEPKVQAKETGRPEPSRPIDAEVVSKPPVDVVAAVSEMSKLDQSLPISEPILAALRMHLKASKVAAPHFLNHVKKHYGCEPKGLTIGQASACMDWLHDQFKLAMEEKAKKDAAGDSPKHEGGNA